MCIFSQITSPPFLKIFNNYILLYKNYFYFLQGVLFLIIGIFILKDVFFQKSLIKKEKKESLKINREITDWKTENFYIENMF